MRKLVLLLTAGAALMLMLFTFSCEKSNDDRYLSISGRVTETDTLVFIEGVVVKAGEIADTTDEAGYFKLSRLPREKQTITLSRTGYRTTTVEGDYTGLLSRPLISRRIIMERETDSLTAPR